MTRGKKKKDTASAVPVPPADFVGKLSEWCKAQQGHKYYKELEFGLRQAIVSDGFDQTKFEGTETIDIPAWPGYKLKVVKKQDFSATNAKGEVNALVAFLSQGAPELAEGLIKWKPEVSILTYRKVLELCDNADIPESTRTYLKGLLAAAITIKPAMPTLELVEPEQPKQ